MARRYTGPDQATVELLRQRCYGWCEFPDCGRLAMDPHHRRNRGMGGRHGATLTWINDLTNLLAACRHHNWWATEGEPHEAWLMGWRLKEGELPWLTPVHTFHDPLPVILHSDGTWTRMADSLTDRSA